MYASNEYINKRCTLCSFARRRYTQAQVNIVWDIMRFKWPFGVQTLETDQSLCKTCKRKSLHVCTTCRSHV